MKTKQSLKRICLCLIAGLLINTWNHTAYPLAADRSPDNSNAIPVEDFSVISNHHAMNNLLPIKNFPQISKIFTPNTIPPTRKLSLTQNSPTVSTSPDPSASPDSSASPDPGTSLDPSASPDPSTSLDPSASPDPSTSLDPSASPKPSTAPDPNTSPKPSKPLIIGNTPSTDTSLPASYDLRDEAIITSIKNQGSSGGCWAFSALKSAESNAIRKKLLPIENADFSENHLIWFSFHASNQTSDPLNVDGFYTSSDKLEAAYYAGGSSLLASFTLARWSGIVMEKTAPFQAESSRKTLSMATSMKQSEKLRYQAKFHVQNATCYDKASRKTIKEALLSKGALSTGMYYSNNYLQKSDSGTATYYQNQYYGSYAINAANHDVTIIGWDDNFSRENFPSYARPTGNGAWLIANSYGNSVGDQGYFWLSYYEPSICEIYSFEVESADNYDMNYQYDGAGWGSALVGNQIPVKAANIYTATRDYHQSLRAVGLYTINDNQPYTVEIYVNTDKNKPTSGTLVSASTTSGTIEYNGFHTIPLKKPVSLKAGTRFSVVVTYSDCPAGKNYLPIEGKGKHSSNNTVQTIYGSKSGQSFFYSSTGNKWLDIAKNGYNNLCVKAYAKNTKPAPVIQLSDKKVVLGKGETYRLKATAKNTGSSKIKYRSSKPAVAKVKKNGKITAKRVGTATITAYIGSTKATCKVKVKKAPTSIKPKIAQKVLKKKQHYQIRTRLSAGSASHKLTFRSQSPKIATVDKQGKVTARKPGTAIITIQTYNKMSAKMTIRVKK